jgi:hypothetical protein
LRNSAPAAVLQEPEHPGDDDWFSASLPFPSSSVFGACQTRVCEPKFNHSSNFPQGSTSGGRKNRNQGDFVARASLILPRRPVNIGPVIVPRHANGLSPPPFSAARSPETRCWINRFPRPVPEGIAAARSEDPQLQKRSQWSRQADESRRGPAENTD